mmetsp:Transcript_13718/g.32028  ORF Transcript_13718/g.32028 Transcript_13718/m.32028 type:complete len:551 (+) Transcript_13718:36-1688(+)
MSTDEEFPEASQFLHSEGPTLTQADLITRSMNQNGGPSQSIVSTSAETKSSPSLPTDLEINGFNNSRAGPASQPQERTDDSGARTRRWLIIFVLFIAICGIVAAIVVPLYVVKPSATPQSTPPTSSPVVPPNVNPTEAPTTKDVGTPPPTTMRFGTFVKNFASTISRSAVFEDPTSPQYKAVNFITNDAKFTSSLLDEATLGDFYAVSAFYYSTGGDFWFECSQGSENCPSGVSWMNPDVSYCEWAWITCNEAGRVIDIVFSDTKDNNLTGTLTSELGVLTELEQFVVVNNDIKGKLPDKLGDLTHVTHFILANNSFSGRIHDTFLENSPVEVFMVSQNKFKGNVPASLTKITSLLQIFLDNNRFSGPIPADFGSLPQLATLDLSANFLEGEIPESIFSASMENLYLGGSTKITGSLSSAVGKARTLGRLHITGTGISGSIPGDLFTLPFLSEIVLSNNKLTGGLPETVSNLGGTLRLMMLDGNGFSGDLPSVAIDELAILNVLTLDRNAFTGAISATTCSQRGEGYFDLQILTVDCAEVTCSCCNNCSS